MKALAHKLISHHWFGGAVTALKLATGFGIRDFIKRHKKAAWIIVALVVANEIRGLIVVGSILWGWGI